MATAMQGSSFTGGQIEDKRAYQNMGRFRLNSQNTLEKFSTPECQVDQPQIGNSCLGRVYIACTLVNNGMHGLMDWKIGSQSDTFERLADI